MPKLASANTDEKKSGGVKESDRISESPPAGCPRPSLRWVRVAARGREARGVWPLLSAQCSSVMIATLLCSSFELCSIGTRCLPEAGCSRAPEVRLRGAAGESVHDGPTGAQNRQAVPAEPSGRAGATRIRPLEPHQSALLGHQHHAKRSESVNTKTNNRARACAESRGSSQTEDRSASCRHSLRSSVPL